MPTDRTPGSSWKRFRLSLGALAVLAWLLVITVMHRSFGARTTKGATELLQIGALPVT